MAKDPKILLKHILESTEMIEQYLAGADREKFLNTPELQDASDAGLEYFKESFAGI